MARQSVFHLRSSKITSSPATPTVSIMSVSSSSVTLVSVPSSSEAWNNHISLSQIDLDSDSLTVAATSPFAIPPTTVA